MIIETNGKTYSTVRGSDINRDGMFLELSRNDKPSNSPIAELFYSDKTKEIVFTSFSEEPIPLLVLKKFIEESASLIPKT